MDAAPTETRKPMQVVVFTLEGKSLALDILKVQEILRMVEITPMPKMPSFALGVINLRGKIVPIINIREKLNLPERKPTVRTCIILIRSDERILGFLVDDVAEVLSLPADSLARPENGTDWVESDLYLGVGKLPGKLLVVIDSDRLLSPKEEKQLQKARKGPMPFQE